MNNKTDQFKPDYATTWVYDERIGWIDINQYLKDIKKMLKELNIKLKLNN
ncbi:hypothetical protein ACOBQJ_02675 [Pelotomaculum propionicicum]